MPIQRTAPTRVKSRQNEQKNLFFLFFNPSEPKLLRFVFVCNLQYGECERGWFARLSAPTHIQKKKRNISRQLILYMYKVLRRREQHAHCATFLEGIYKDARRTSCLLFSCSMRRPHTYTNPFAASPLPELSEGAGVCKDIALSYVYM